nr:unnamed protein product [Callosobruchus analis]
MGDLSTPGNEATSFKGTLGRIAENYYRRTNFPNCIGSVDEKHIRLISPLHSGSAFYNYKNYYSVVLLAVVDSDCGFIAIDVGAYGRDSDSNIFQQLDFWEKPNTNDTPLPYVFLGDEAFPLNNNFMKPYPRSNSQYSTANLELPSK